MIKPRENSRADLQKKEKQAYQALAAIIGFIKNEKKHECLKLNDTAHFNQFKKLVLTSADEFKRDPVKFSTAESQFPVKHYERAILCATSATYRDVAIQAAIKDLSKEALLDLILVLRKNCCQFSRQIKANRGVRQLWKNVLDSTSDDPEVAVIL